MNSALTTLLDKVADNIEAKKSATPNPALIKAEDLSDILEEIINYLNSISAPPEAPAGVSFITSPTFTIGTNSITESASVVNNNGATVNVAGATIAVPYAATGKKRLDSIVVNYLAVTPVYERIAGDEVAVTAIAARKPIPANRLFAHDIDVTDGAVSTSTPTNAHQQNTDVGTSSPIFTIQRNSQNQDPNGVTVLGFGTQQGGNVCAIGLQWANDGAGTESYAFKACYDYTPTGSNTWVDFGSSYTDAQAIAANASAIAAKLDIEVATATGSAIAFTTDKFYNTSASPATGNITITTTGGKPGVVVVVVHNSGTAPLVNGAAIGTAANACKLVDGSQTYKLGVNNYFEFRYFSATEIHYSIYQLKP